MTKADCVVSEPSEPSSDLLNPYQSANVEVDDWIAAQQRTFSTNYWISVVMLFAAAAAFCFFSPSFGIIGIVTMCFVVLRSWMWSHRLRMQQLSGKALPAPIHPHEFLFGSIGIGIAATLASAIAFVCTCLPLGFIGAMTFNFPMFKSASTFFGIELPFILFIGLVTACALFAFWLACSLIRATLPAVSQEIQPEAIDNDSIQN